MLIRIDRKRVLGRVPAIRFIIKRWNIEDKDRLLTEEWKNEM